MEERDCMNKFILKGKERKECFEHKKYLATKIDNLTEDRKQLDCLIQSTNQLIVYKKKDIKHHRSSNNKH